MIKFLVTIFLLGLGYLGITAISKYDTLISITVFDYRYTASLFLVMVLSLMLIILSSMSFKLITIILKTPYLIAEKLSGYKKRSRTKAIMEAYGNIVIGNMEAAERIISRIDLNDLDEDFKEHANLIATISNKDFDKNMVMLQNLLSNKSYHDFAAQSLAHKIYAQGYYAQSLQYAEQIRINDNISSDLMLLLIRLYANLNMWEKFDSTWKRYSGIYSKNLSKDSHDIANYYLKAAKFFLASGEEDKALDYLESSLTYDPVNIESIELLCNINLSLGKSNLNISILEKAFSHRPSFALFELYKASQADDYNPQNLYDILVNLVDITNYKSVFLAIAADLNLLDEIASIKNYCT